MLRWFVNTTVIKLAVIALVVKEVWLLMGIPAVANAVIEFCTVGQIPGTTIMLSAAQTFVLSGWALLIAILLIFQKEFKELLVRSRRTVRYIPQPLVRSQRRAPRPSVFIRAEKRLVASAQHSRSVIGQMYLRARPYLLRAYRILRAVTLTIGHGIMLVSLAIWRWAEPPIRRFDHYLDVMLHRNPVSRALLAFAVEVWIELTIWANKLKTTYDNAMQSHDMSAK